MGRQMGWPADGLPQAPGQLSVSGAAGQGARESTWAGAAEDQACEVGRRGSAAQWPTSRAPAVPPHRGGPTSSIYSGHFTFEQHSHEDH